MRILVHVCCAPCFTYLHKVLTEDEHEIVGYFFNPNIHPYQEFLKRMHCLERYTALRPVEVIYDKSYELDRYLVGALKAMYDTPPRVNDLVKKSRAVSNKGAFEERQDVKENFELRLTPKNGPVKTITNIDEQIPSPGMTNKNENKDSDFNPRCGYCISLRLARTAKLAADKGFDGFTTTLLESKYQPHEYIHSIGNKLATKHGIEFYYQDFRLGWKESIRISKELELYRQQYCGCIFSEYDRFGPK